MHSHCCATPITLDLQNEFHLAKLKLSPSNNSLLNGFFKSIFFSVIEGTFGWKLRSVDTCALYAFRNCG